MGYIFVYGYLTIWWMILTLLKKYFNLKVEFTRKIMHIATGFTWIIIDHFYFGSIHMVIIPITFIFINVISWRFNLFTIVERDRNNNHLGTIYYAIAYTITQFVSFIQPAYRFATGIAISVLTFGDGFSSLLGSFIKKGNPRLIYHKTLIGFLATALFSFLGVFLFQCYYLTDLTIFDIIIVALTGAVLEISIDKGLDNFTIYFGITALAYLLI